MGMEHANELFIFIWTILCWHLMNSCVCLYKSYAFYISHLELLPYYCVALTVI